MVPAEPISGLMAYMNRGVIDMRYPLQTDQDTGWTKTMKTLFSKMELVCKVLGSRFLVIITVIIMVIITVIMVLCLGISLQGIKMSESQIRFEVITQ